MTAAPARLPAPGDPAALTRHLDAIAAALDGYGVGYQITRPAGTPILTTVPPAGPGAATVAIDPDMHARPDPQLDCTCVWTPAPDTSPETTAAVIAAVLAATRLRLGAARRPPPAAAARLSAFLGRYPGWSVFWDPRYGLWRAAEDDPGSALYAETPDPDAVMTYITACSRTPPAGSGSGPCPASARLR